MFPKGLTVQFISTLHKIYAMKFYKCYYKHSSIQYTFHAICVKITSHFVKCNICSVKGPLIDLYV